jgi:ribosomal protein S18 acetylase RimI-like enzyme
VPSVNKLVSIRLGDMLFSWYCQRDEVTNQVTTMQIRPIEESDVEQAGRLLRELSTEFILHESTTEGAATFLRENDEAAIRRYIDIGHVYHVAEIDGEIAGFIAVRDRSHLFHMFVGVKWQGQGLARKLWNMARGSAIADGGSGVFTVNSSNYALPVYEALGFVRTAPMQCLKGLYFNPMKLEPDERER